jgi:hypothetical protein
VTIPEWFDFFDPARLAGFLGFSQLVAGRAADAVVTVHRALEQLDDQPGKQRSVVLLDLAAAHATTDAEHGMDLAAQAFDQLEQGPYGTAHGRISALRRRKHGCCTSRRGRCLLLASSGARCAPGSTGELRAAKPNTAKNVCRGTPSQSAHVPYSRVSSTIVSPTSKNTALLSKDPGAPQSSYADTASVPVLVLPSALPLWTLSIELFGNSLLGQSR